MKNKLRRILIILGVIVILILVIIIAKVIESRITSISDKPEESYFADELDVYLDNKKIGKAYVILSNWVYPNIYEHLNTGSGSIEKQKKDTLNLLKKTAKERVTIKKTDNIKISLDNMSGIVLLQKEKEYSYVIYNENGDKIKSSNSKFQNNEISINLDGLVPNSSYYIAINLWYTYGHGKYALKVTV